MNKNMIKINRDEITNYYNISARKYYSCISDALNKYDEDKILKIKRTQEDYLRKK